jgi:23S rRNA pseudouridine2605 synthase
MMEIIKFLRSQTNLARRKITNLIKDGKIRVNDKVIESFTYKLDPKKDVVKIENKLIKYKFDYVYYKFNKPKDVICSLSDSRNRKDLSFYLNKVPVSLFPVGRLDRATRGLLLFTNDGEAANKIAHPSYRITKYYKVEIDTVITKDHLKRLIAGIVLEDGLVNFESIECLSKREFLLSLHEGRNRIIRRVFAYLGYEVIKLKRLAIGPIQLGKLKEGELKELTLRETRALMNALRKPSFT